MVSRRGALGAGQYGEGLVNSSVGCRVAGLRKLAVRAEQGGVKGCIGEVIVSWAANLVSKNSSGGSRGELPQQVGVR